MPAAWPITRQCDCRRTLAWASWVDGARVVSVGQLLRKSEDDFLLAVACVPDVHQPGSPHPAREGPAFDEGGPGSGARSGDGGGATGRPGPADKDIALQQDRVGGWADGDCHREFPVGKRVIRRPPRGTIGIPLAGNRATPIVADSMSLFKMHLWARAPRPAGAVIAANAGIHVTGD